MTVCKIHDIILMVILEEKFFYEVLINLVVYKPPPPWNISTISFLVGVHTTVSACDILFILSQHLIYFFIFLLDYALIIFDYQWINIFIKFLFRVFNDVLVLLMWFGQYMGSNFHTINIHSHFYNSPPENISHLSNNIVPLWFHQACYLRISCVGWIWLILTLANIYCLTSFIHVNYSHWFSLK